MATRSEGSMSSGTGGLLVVAFIFIGVGAVAATSPTASSASGTEALRCAGRHVWRSSQDSILNTFRSTTAQFWNRIPGLQILPLHILDLLQIMAICGVFSGLILLTKQSLDKRHSNTNAEKPLRRRLISSIKSPSNGERPERLAMFVEFAKLTHSC